MSEPSPSQTPSPSSAAAAVKQSKRQSARREMLLAGLIGSLVIGLLLYAFLTANFAGGINGVIVEKRFIEAPETQFTIGGRQGFQKDDVPGRFELRVKDPRENGKIYRIPVTQVQFESLEVGDAYYFVPAPDSMIPQRNPAPAPAPSANGNSGNAD